MANTFVISVLHSMNLELRSYAGALPRSDHVRIFLVAKSSSVDYEMQMKSSSDGN